MSEYYCGDILIYIYSTTLCTQQDAPQPQRGNSFGFSRLVYDA